MNTAQLALDCVDKYGDFPAFYFEGQTISSLEHAAYGKRLATVLRERGVKARDRVLVLMHNCPEVLACFQAVWKLGAVIIPITPQLSEREVNYVLDHSDAVTVITSSELAPRVRAASEGVEGIRHMLIIGEQECEGLENISEAIANADEFTGIFDCAEDDMAFLLYTSGTTGRPKGVMLSHNNIVSDHVGQSAFKRLEERSTTLLCLPLSHAFGVMIMNLGYIFGATASIHRKFNPVEIFATIEKFKVTRFSAVPTMLARFLDTPEREKYDLSSLEIINCGASILHNDVRLKFEKEFQCKLLDGYGQSESSPTACSYRSAEFLRPGSAGHAIPGVTISIQDESGALLSTGEHGEICIQGPNVMLGYLKDEEATRHALRGGWLHSGDIGYLDEDGYIFLTDRIKDLIIKGGENISPREIEEGLYEHPAVNEVSVVGFPHTTYGEDICAVIAFLSGQEATEQELRDHLAKYVTKFKIPSRFEFRKELPKIPNGKVDRKLLRKQVAQ